MTKMVTKVLEQAEEEDFGMSTLGQVEEIFATFKQVRRDFCNIQTAEMMKAKSKSSNKQTVNTDSKISNK